MTRIQPRPAPPQHIQRLVDAGTPALLARIYAARGLSSAQELEYSFSSLLPPNALRGNREAARLLADAIAANAPMLIVADYDCDGATACAVAIRALRAFGAKVGYLVPDRFKYGYGLSPAIVELAARSKPAVLITVDNGIASLEGVTAAHRHGMQTVVTDHHLPGDALPQADVIVNPNQATCDFPSKSIAGVGVIFYTMLALRAELRQRGAFAARAEPRLSDLLDLVALGTIADVVCLDHNNRILVSQGLSRIRAGRCQPGIRALFAASGLDISRANTSHLGFGLAPRINAAGRLANMGLGIECLISDDPAQVLNIARSLDQLNRERRDIEQKMRAVAISHLDDFDPGRSASVCLFEPDWHQGVIGIVAGRIKERVHRPVFAFARSNKGELKGSGRSIQGLHLRDALDLLSKQQPNLLLQFGGHAMAAGVCIQEHDFANFQAAFDDIAQSLLSPADLEQRLDSDGAPEPSWMSLHSAQLIEQGIWGHGFPAPLFDDFFRVSSQRILKERHRSLKLQKDSAHYDAIQFNFDPSVAMNGNIHAAFQLAVNEYNGISKLQLVLKHLEAE